MSKHKAPATERGDINQPGLFVYTPRAPGHGQGKHGWQCMFGGQRHVVQNYIGGAWVLAGVYRDSEKDNAELRIALELSDGGRNEANLTMGSNDMERLAMALLDAAHHLRTVPAAPFVAPVKADAEAVPA
jgi:hypothetical protein